MDQPPSVEARVLGILSDYVSPITARGLVQMSLSRTGLPPSDMASAGDARVLVHLLHGLRLYVDVGLVDDFYADLDRFLDEETPHVLVTDARHISAAPSVLVRRAIASHNARTEARRSRLTLASFVVIDSPIIRGALTAIRWIDPSLADVESPRRWTRRSVAPWTRSGTRASTTRPR